MDELTGTVLLTARKLFHNDDNSNSTSSSKSHICPAVDTSGPQVLPVTGDITFHRLALIISGATCILCLLVSFFNVFSHATHYSAPTEQRQIIRIILLIPWFSLVAFLSILAGDNAKYFENALEVGESLALSAFLLLLCDYIIAGDGGMDKLFHGVSAKDSSVPNSAWLKKAWYGVLQFIPISIIVWITTAASEAAGTYCASSNNIHFAHIWVTVITFISTGAAILCILRFYGHMKPDLAAHNVFLKLFSFKTVVGLNWLQSFILRILVSSKVIHTTSHLSYTDIQTGIPMLLLSIEMPFFAILLLYAYPASPYKASSKPRLGGPLGIKAIASALFVADLISALVRGPMRLVRNQKVDLTSGHDGEERMGFVNAKPTSYEGAPASWMEQQHMRDGRDERYESYSRTQV